MRRVPRLSRERALAELAAVEAGYSRDEIPVRRPLVRATTLPRTPRGAL